MRYPKQEVDKFTIQLLQNHSDNVRQQIEDPSPFFMTRLWATISKEQQATQFWEFGVISAKKWLVALSCIAILSFFGNIIAVGTQPDLLSRTSITESSHFEPDNEDDVHSEALNVDMLQKE